MSTNAQSSALSPLEQAQYNTLLEMLPEMFPNGYPPPAAPTSEAASTTTDSAPVDPVHMDDNELISDVSQYIGTYLQCSEHQRTVLAFWVLHTYCFYRQDVTAYLSLQSAQPQAGKTRCLQLLNFLLHKPSLTCGLTVSTLFHRMRLARPSGILLDECQATFGTRSRPKAPILRALLATNAHIQHGYMSFKQDVDVYVPKAFAGRGPLPEELAELSLPIILEPLRDRKAVKRLAEQTCTEAHPLGDRLMAWSQAFLRQKKESPNYVPQEPPASLSHLSFRRQDIIEPLLELAGKLGGEWPQRLEQALLAIFEDEARFNLQASLDVLNAMYNCFFHYGFPERISTAMALEWLQAQPKRPWEVDGPMTAQKLARLLMAFAISPRLQRMGKGTNAARGYLLEDFRPVWKKYFNYEFLPAEALHPKSEILNGDPQRGPGLHAVGSNKDAACNGLVQAAQVIVSAQANSGDYRSQEAGFGVDLQRQEPGF
jgi:hypothetical protein